MKELISRAVPAVVAVASKEAAAPAPGLEHVLAVPKDTLVPCVLYVSVLWSLCIKFSATIPLLYFYQ
jgi:hypothetical protein